MRMFLEKTIKYLLFTSFLTPLFFFPAVWSRFIFPFIVPKIVFFRSLVLLLLGAFVLLLLIDYKRYKIKNTPLTLAVIGFILSFFLSTFIGVDFYRSLWDNHERMLGLFTVAHYVLYYLIATTVVKGWEEWKVFFRWFLVAGSVVVVLGALQKINPDLLLNQGNDRVSSTLGNAIYFAGYGLFLGFIGIFLYFKDNHEIWRKISLGLGIFSFSAIFLSSTRGTLLGLLVGAFVTLVLYLLRMKENKKVRTGILISFGVGIVILTSLFAFRSNATVRNLPAIGRLLNSISEITERSPRLMSWGIAVESWKEKPFFGWGPNNFYYAFNKYYSPEFLNFGWSETWFDNAHNVILNTLAVQGIFGLISYVALFAVAVWYLWRRYQQNTLDHHTAFLSIGFLVAHFIHNIFVFENPTSYLYFFFFLAYINSTLFLSAEEKQVASSKKLSVFSFAAVVIVILFFINATDIKPAKANMSTFKTMQSLYTGQNILANYQNTMAASTPHIDDVRNDIARIVYSVLPQYVEAKRVAEIEPVFTAVYADMKKNIELHPMDVRVYMQEAQLAQAGAQYLNRSELLLESESYLTTALQYSPKRQQVQFMLAALKLGLGRNDEAIQILTETKQNNPHIAESWLRLGQAYAFSKKSKELNDLFEQAKKQGIVISDEQKQTLLSVLKSS